MKPVWKFFSLEEFAILLETQGTLQALRRNQGLGLESGHDYYEGVAWETSKGWVGSNVIHF